MQQQQQQGLDIDKLQQVVKTRWLKPQEVLKILQNHELFTISHKNPQMPQSGSWFLYNRRILKYFRSDGYNWQKKKNGKTINEVHERLKVDNVDALNCYYARGDKNPTFQRRIYWMLDPAFEHIVLVHYRDVLQGSISVSVQNDSSISNQKGGSSRAEVHSSPGLTSELIVQCPSSCSVGSAEEVSSLTSASESHWIQHEVALRKLKMQLSKEDCDVNAEDVPGNNEPIILPGIQNEEPDTSMNLDDNFDVLDFGEPGTHPCPSAIDVLKNSDTWLEEDQLEAILHPACITLAENQWFKIHEVSPESAFSSESTKVIIVGDFLCDPPHSSWEVLFGDVKVPVEIIQQGVIRCHTPCLNAGKVRMCLIDGNGKSCSEAREFYFLEKPTKGMIDGNMNPCNEARDPKAHQIPTKSSDELSLLLHYVQTLFDGHACGLFSNFSSPLPNLDCKFQINQMDIIKKTYEHLDPENTVNCVMEALLNDKFKQWLSHKCEQNIDGDHLLPKQYHSIIHTIAALGYVLDLKQLLSSGVPINYRDTNGWTALHWAARFGREDMVVALLAAGAAAGALSHPTSEDAAAKTPASIALAHGFKGLSAFLSEAQLTTHLDSIESKENGKLNSMEWGTCRAVERISDKSSHVHGGTEDQLALKDSLGAVRNAVQAAGRIQAAFRIFSFKKKKEMALQSRNSCLSISETGAISHGVLEKAALSIQKNFRFWKTRKEFLRIRNNVVRIQARVRAHQERKKYKELLSSVGVLEKVMIRWYCKGVGLRGFNSGAMPIDKEVDDDVAKVFRKLRVETAIDESVSRVSCLIGSPKGMQQYRRMLQKYQQAEVEVEEPYSSLYKDVMAWFSMGKQRQKGLGHTCMKQAGHKLLGRDDIRQKVMENMLLDRNVGSDCTVICISGGSGLGKTSLLHGLYNDQELINAFDKRIWIQISGKLDILMLFRKIIEFDMNDHCSIMNIDLLRELVMEEITDKKFLLFLDDADIQDQQCWTSILEVLNAGAKDSAVVMATNSTNDVLRDIATHSYFLNPLPEESNMMILQQYSGVGTDIQSNPDLMMIAKRFISRFGSNPLNLKSICGLLCHADTNSLDKEKFEESVMPLQLCHDVLPSHLKNCLAFCSLFPEGYIFDKHHMVRQWISHGCVRTLEGYELEDVGLEYFSELLCRSFFQPSPIHNEKDHKFVMHELMYKVLESVVCDRYFKSENQVSSVPESILHLSFVASQFQTVKLMSTTEELKDLQTFLVVQPEWKAYNISFPTLNLDGLDEFFLKFTSLETLDLSHTDIEELPGSIVSLRNLQYLSVNSTNVRALPSELCSLSNLQTLEAKHCRFLTELPGDVKKLVKLRHLDLTKELDYVHLPRGIGELTELQTLPVFHVSGDLSRCSINELETLHNLSGCLWLSGLESVKTGSKAQEASLKDKHRLKDLTLQWHDDGTDIEDEDEENVADEQVLESLQPHASLQVLTIRGYKGSRFPAWMQGSSFLPNLVTLTLDSCCNCTEFPAIAQLPSLKSLSVRKMFDVRWLSSNPHGDGAAKFPSLELLNLWEMYGLEELLFKESEGDCPRLRKVCISRCPDLKRLPRAPPVMELVLHCGHQFPDISELTSLVSLKIEGFHGTKSFRLPPSAALRKLEIRSCKELLSVDGLLVLTTVRRLKIEGCPKLVLPGTSCKYRMQPSRVAGKEIAADGLQSFTKKRGPGDGVDAVEKDGHVLKESK